MLNAIRRGNGCLTSLAFQPLKSSRPVNGFPFRSIFPPPRVHAILITTRSLHWTPQLNREAVAVAQGEAEEEAIEEQIRQDANSQRPLSDSQLGSSTRAGPVTKFAQLAERQMVSPTIVKTIVQGMGLETMTQVQSLTINETLKGVDVIAQARTGTGKTLAFLIPVLQNIISFDPSLESSARRRAFDSSAGSRCDIRAIIISPTRELAEQIAAEAQKVVRDTGVIVQTAVGGSSKQIGLQRIVRNGCHILVATPGRLNDILSDPRSGVRAPNLSALVLDEADRLLDQGFSVELQEIQKLLPNRREVDRQTLLFSATIPREVMDIARHTMKPDFKYVRTVQEGEQQTHERIPQMVVTVPGYENMWPALLELCQKEMSRKGAEPFKAIVYMNATAEVSLGASIFRNLKEPGASTFQTHPLHPARIIEIHARLTQAQRTRAADAFRAAKSAIMFSSDVTARGMDFPNVTHVIQVGIPSNRDTYIHRVGRTGRGDKKGEGWLFTTDMESRELRSRLFKLPLKQDQSLEAARVDMSRDTTRSPDVDAIFNRITTATKPVPFEMKSKAFISSFGIYAWMPQKSALVEALNRRAKYEWDMDTPPAVSPNLASKLGFSRVPGINVGHDDRMPMFSRDDAPGFGRGRSSSGYGGGSSGYGGGAGRRSSSGSSDYGRDRGSYESRGPRQGFGRSTGDDRGYQGKRFGGDGGEGRSSTPAWQQRGRVPKPRY